MAPSSMELLTTAYQELNNEKVSSITLVGEPGVGKTWIARKLSERAIREGKFDITLWVYMKRKYDRITLYKSIATQLSLLFEEDGIEGSEYKKHIEDIREKLVGKRILLICDDQEEYDVWPELETLVVMAQPSSHKFLITRANDGDGRIAEGTIIKVEPLSEEESISLLFEIVGTAVYELPGIRDLAQVFVRKSKRLPTDIVIIAKALSYFGKSESGLEKLEMAKEEAMLLDDGHYNVLQLLLRDYAPLPSSVVIDCCLDSHFLRSRGSLHYTELISYWILEGYLGDFDCIEDACENGHPVFTELIDCGLLKELEAGYVVMNGANLNLEPYDHRRIFVEAVRLGLAAVYNGGFGRVVQADGTMKAFSIGDWKKKVSTLLLAMEPFITEVPHDIYDSTVNLEVLAVFNPIFSTSFGQLPLPLEKMRDLRMLVLRGCEWREKIEEAFRLKNSPDPLRFSTPDFNPLKLTVLEISGLSYLKEIPENLFKRTPRLQSLNLSSLEIHSLPRSFYDLTEIVYLILRGCSFLKKIESLLKFKKLEVLDLSGAKSLEFESNRSISNKEIRILNLSESGIRSLPQLHGHNLTHLLLSQCTELVTLPSISTKSTIQILDLSGATKLTNFGGLSLKDMIELKVLNISGTAIAKLPTNVSNPRSLYLSSCNQLKQLKYIDSIRDLQVLDLSGSIDLEEIDDNFFSHLTCLRVLNLSGTSVKTLPSLSSLCNLRQLLLSHCLSLEKLGELDNLKKLELLDLSGCTILRELQLLSFEEMQRLRMLDISGTKITCLPSLPNPSNLHHLLLQNCTNLVVLPSLESSLKLRELNLSGVRAIAEIGAGFVEHMTDLRILDLSETKLKDLPSLSNLKNLTFLSLRNCPDLNEVPGLDALTSLEVLDLSGTAIKDLPLFQNFGNLRWLLLKDCSNLKEFKILDKISELTQLEQLELPHTEVRVTAKSSKCSVIEVKQYQWNITCWPAEVLTSDDKRSTPVNSIQFLQLLEENPHLFETILNIHLLIKPIQAQNTSKDAYSYKSELLSRKIYFQSRQFPQFSKQEGSVEIRKFEYLPKGLELILAHAKSVFLIENQFIGCLPDLGADNINELKACWIERCCNMENVLRVDLMGNAPGTGDGSKSKGEGGKSDEIISHDTNSMNAYNKNHQGSSFDHLKSLYLDYCPKLSNICFSSQQLRNLEVLQIKYCHELEKLFEHESASLERLQTLQLWGLPKLKNIACKVPSLNNLIVGDCPVLVHVLFSKQISKDLKILQIKFCDTLEAIFEGSELTLPELQSLHLLDLPELKSIGADLPSLRDKIIRGCPKIY